MINVLILLEINIKEKGLNYKLRNDLEIYKSKELESTFTEITQNKEIIVADCRNSQNVIVTTLQIFKKNFV